jgi:hypothetical protein
LPANVAIGWKRLALTSLIPFGKYYDPKKFYSPGPSCQFLPKRTFLATALFGPKISVTHLVSVKVSFRRKKSFEQISFFSSNCLNHFDDINTFF